jgi:hypothetical protein
MQKTLTRAEQSKKALKARVAVAMYDEYGKVPSEDEIENTYRWAWVLYKAVLGTHYMRR